MAYNHELTDDEKRELLRIARTTLREWQYTEMLPPGKPHKVTLLAPAGVFVTLRRGKALRGCVGTVEARSPIYKAVQEMAVAAANRDPRFAPISDEELEGVVIEISVLGQTHPIRTAGELTVGQHGVSIRLADKRGLLLPQVATERGWDAATLLAQVCEKAGLAPDAWSHADAVVEVFEAQVFDELEHPAVESMDLGDD